MKIRPFFSAVFFSVILSLISFSSISGEMGGRVVFAENGSVIAVSSTCKEGGDSVAGVKSINVMRFVARDDTRGLAESLYGARFSKGGGGALSFFSGGELENPVVFVPEGSPFQDIEYTSRYLDERYGLVEGTYDVVVSGFFSWGRQSSSRLGMTEALEVAVGELESFPGMGSVDIDVGKISMQSSCLQGD